MSHDHKTIAPGPGRPKGSKNRKGLNVELRERLKEMGCDPLEGLARIALDMAARPDKKMAEYKLESWCYAELAQYCLPKLKAVEHSGKIETTPMLVIDLGGQPKTFGGEVVDAETEQDALEEPEQAPLMDMSPMETADRPEDKA